MARFTAYTSDTSSDEEQEEKNVSQKTSDKLSSRTPNNDVVPEQSESGEGSASSSSSSSEMDEDELNSPPRPTKKRQNQDRNALVEDENGDVHFAHEIHVSPPSSPSRSSPPRIRPNVVGDPTIIPWAQHVGVDPQKMHVMQTSLFRMPEEAAALRAFNESTKTRPSGIRLEVGSKNQGVNRKHSRDSDGDGLRSDARERASFAQDIEPVSFRPTRKYARVGITSSIANGNEGAWVDAGLALGRSFRVGWGPGGQLVHLGSICSPMTTTTTSANTSTISIMKILPSLSISRSDPNSLASSSVKPPELASKLLQHHLSHTTLSRDDNDIPCAYPTSDFASPPTSTQDKWTHATAPSPDPLNFSSFTTLFPTTDISSPAPIFRLGRALFDPMDLHLARPTKQGATSISDGNVTPDIRNRVNILRRKNALSEWLENVVKPSVEGDLRVQSSGSNATYTLADAVFTRLTGHQVSDACTTAADGGYLKLSTLISQAGGDDIYKADILSQLDVWKAEKLSPGTSNTVTSTQNGLVGRGVWRVYNLLSGLVQEQEDTDTTAEESVFGGLDWKRVFGLCLWYGTSVNSSVADVVAAYERILTRKSKGAINQVARPIPKWAANHRTGPSPLAAPGLGLFMGSSIIKEAAPEDPLYILIRLYADPALSLSNALNPLSYAPSSMDWGIAMCWHLYIVLSRVMKVRDFADRGDPGVRPPKMAPAKGRSSLVNGFGGARRGGSARSDTTTDVSKDGDGDGDVQPEGHSPTADLLASSYAFELESWGMIQEAAFVLLHLEGSSGREKALKDLLARSGPKLNDWMIRGLVGSLKLPMTWVDEARAMYEFDKGNIFAAYELYLSAQLYNAAHNLALLELAPDAIIRKDLKLLDSLFDAFDKDGKRDKIDGWFVKGKIVLDYVETMIELPRLMNEVLVESEDAEAIPDTARSEAIDYLAKRIPKIIALLPDIFHRNRATDPRHPAALEEMTKDLLKVMERAQPLLLADIRQPALTVFDGATKINLLRGVGCARFLQSIEA